jgi:hypothetical protein
MLKRFRLPNSSVGWLILSGALGFIALATIAFISRPRPLPYVTHTISLEQCGGEQARKATTEAKQRLEDPWLSQDTVIQQKAAHAVTAAEQRQKDAEACEERLHSKDDLAAQWRSAIAAQNSADVAGSLWLWAVVELVLLGGTFAAAVVAVREARRAADAVMNVDRAWLLHESNELLFFDMQDPPLFPDEKPVATFRLKNTGSSAAWVVSAEAHLILFSKVEDLPKIPKYDGKNSKGPSGDLAILKDDMHYGGLFTLEIDHWTPEFRKDVQLGRKHIFFYGRVCYNDVFGREHISQFGHEWTIPGALSDRKPFFRNLVGDRWKGYGAYNKYT